MVPIKEIYKALKEADVAEEYAKTHQIDEKKGGCQVCGVDTGTIHFYKKACTGPLNLRVDIHNVEELDMNALQERFGSHEIGPIEKLLATPIKNASHPFQTFPLPPHPVLPPADVPPGEPPLPPNVKKVKPLPPRTVEDA